MNEFLAALADICRDHLFEEKWLVAPSLRVGYQWLDTMTRNGRNSINTRPATFRKLVLDLADPIMAETNSVFVSSMGGAIVVDGIFNEIKKQSPGYLTSLELSSGLAVKVYSAVNDLRLAGLGHRNLPLRAFETQDKSNEIYSILEKYDEELVRLKLVDYSTALDMALSRFSGPDAPIGDDVLILIPDGMGLSKKERDLLSAIPEKNLLFIPVDRPNHQAVSLWDLPESPNSLQVTVFRALGEVNEIREVFRRCLENEIPFDEVEILHTDANIYVPLIYESAAALQPDFSGVENLFATFEEGIPAKYSRPGKAVAGWISWISGGYLQSELVKLIHEGVLKIPDHDGCEFGHEAAARLLKSLPVGFGRKRYLEKTTELMEALENRLTERRPNLEETDPAEEAGETNLNNRLSETKALDILLRGLFAHDPSEVSLSKEILECALGFLNNCTRNVNQLDNYVLKAFVQDISNLISYLDDAEELSLDALDWLKSLPFETRVLGSGPRPGKLHVANVFSGGHSGRKHTFIVGLDDSRFPGTGLQDPVILDEERLSISSEIPTAAGRLSKKLEQFNLLLARIRGTVTLSYPCRDLIDDREMFPSTVLLSIFRSAGNDPDADFSDLLKYVGSPVTFVGNLRSAPTEGTPEDSSCCLNSNEWLLRSICSGESVFDPARVLECVNPHLARGKKATEKRLSADFTEYDGRILNPGPELDPSSRNGRAISDSSLETLGRCPLAYFFRYVLEIYQPYETSVDLETWLGPADFGSLMHEVFYKFVAEISRSKWPPSYAEDLDLILTIAEDLAQQYKRRFPPPSHHTFLVQRDKLFRAAEIFLRNEELSTERKPVFLESSIGVAGYMKGTGLDSKFPILLEPSKGSAIRFRGRLDRIDEITAGEPNRYAVCDYKSGSAFKYGNEDPFHQGRVVQHVLYMAAAEKLLRKSLMLKSHGPIIKEFCYFFPGDKHRGLTVAFDNYMLSAGLEIVGKLCSISRNGSFLATNDPGVDCTFCDYTEICGDLQELSQACNLKLANDNNPTLRDMRELRNSGNK